MDRLTAAQNAHDLEGMLACFHEDYRSEQPLFPSRTFQGIDQVRANWSALLAGIPDFHAEILRSAVDDDTLFVEIHWTGTKADGTPLDERGVLIMGVREGRIAWARLYADEVERESDDIDAVVRRMAGTEDRYAHPPTNAGDDQRRCRRAGRRSDVSVQRGGQVGVDIGRSGLRQHVFDPCAAFERHDRDVPDARGERVVRRGLEVDEQLVMQLVLIGPPVDH